MAQRREEWEYCRLWNSSNYHLENCELAFYTASGVVTEDLSRLRTNSKDAAVRRITQLGSEGWELAAADNNSLYFKRRKM